MKIGTIVAGIAGGIVMFLLGFLFFGYLLSDYFKANTIQYAGLMKDPPIIPFIFMFNLVWAWLIAFILEYGGRTGWAEGAKIGAITLFMISLGINIEFEAFMNVHESMAPILVQLVVIIVMGLIAGAVIGLVQGKFSQKTAEAV